MSTSLPAAAQRLRTVAQLWTLEFPGSNAVGVHRVGERLVVFDALGRVIVMKANGDVEAVVRTKA